MPTPLLIGILIAVVVVLAATGAIVLRRPSPDPDQGLATSTEGMKICPKCGMGNLWTERRCSACGEPLKG